VGFIRKTRSGAQAAYWRDPAGRQRSKAFNTKREASAFLAEVESSLSRGTYVDPNAGRIRFGEFARRWLESGEVEARTAERTLSILRTHVLPQWSDWPIARIDHMAVQDWVTTLVRRRARGTVVRCHNTLSMILKTAVRARLIAINPAEGVRIPKAHNTRANPMSISQADFVGKLLPAVPLRYRALVCLAAFGGLRWGECAGLTWGSVDLDMCRIKVRQVAVETPSTMTLRPFPKSRAGQRVVPLPSVLTESLTIHRNSLVAHPAENDLVFPSKTGGPLRRNNFRRRVWLPSLVRAGLLGQVEQMQEGFRASWHGSNGKQTAMCRSHQEAIVHIANKALGALRFHDLRHSYATWLVTEGVPVNVVRLVMGHEQTSTTLDIYTHAPSDYEARVLSAFEGSAVLSLSSEINGPAGEHESDVQHMP
jgi:integrase